jgi:hypothetical protein
MPDSVRRFDAKRSLTWPRDASRAVVRAEELLMKRLTLPVLAIATLATRALFAAEPAPPRAAGAETIGGEKEFGDQGVVAFGAATSLNLGYTQTSPPSGPSSNITNISIVPEIQYFVITGLSVGGIVVFDWAKPSTGDSTTTIGIGPTVGYNFWISPGLLSLWPQATFTFNNASTSIPSPTGGTVSGSLTTTNVGVFVPLLIHPVKHFHFGVGPYFNIDLSSKESAGGTSVDGDKAMNLGIRGEIAGWL